MYNWIFTPFYVCCRVRIVAPPEVDLAVAPPEVDLAPPKVDLAVTPPTVDPAPPTYLQTYAWKARIPNPSSVSFSRRGGLAIPVHRCRRVQTLTKARRLLRPTERTLVVRRLLRPPEPIPRVRHLARSPELGLQCRPLDRPTDALGQRRIILDLAAEGTSDPQTPPLWSFGKA